MDEILRYLQLSFPSSKKMKVISSYYDYKWFMVCRKSNENPRMKNEKTI